MKIKEFIFLGIILLISVSSAQAGLELGVQDVVKAALKSSESLMISENNLKKSNAVYKQIRAGLLPHFNANAAWTHNDQYPVTADRTTDYELSSGIKATQLLWSFGKVSAAVDAAKKSVQAIKLGKQVKQLDIVYTAKLSYYSFLFAKNAFMINKESYNTIVENKKLLEQRSEAGRSSKRDIIKMDADIAARIPQLNDARSQWQTALKTLNTLIDVPLDTQVEPIDSFEMNNKDIIYNQQVKKFYANEPSLKSLDAQIDAAEALLNSRQNDRLATISLFASADYNGGSNAKNYIGSESMDEYFSAGISVNMPLWNGGEKWAIIEQAKADRNNIKLQRKQEEENLLMALKVAVVEYTEYKNTLKANNQAVRLAKESYEITRDMFESGQISLTDLNDAEQLLTGQKLRLEQTLYNIAVTKAMIERLTVKD